MSLPVNCTRCNDTGHYIEHNEVYKGYATSLGARHAECDCKSPAALERKRLLKEQAAEGRRRAASMEAMGYVRCRGHHNTSRWRKPEHLKNGLCAACQKHPRYQKEMGSD